MKWDDLPITYLGPGFGRRDDIMELAWADPRARPNPGLLFDRFLDLDVARRRHRTGEEAEGPSEVLEGIEAFGRRLAQVASPPPQAPDEGGKALLAAWHARLDRHGVPLGDVRGGLRAHHVYADVELCSPLIVGAGEAHAFENGMTFHATLGVPYLPGTALKGIVRSWLDIVGEADDGKGELLGTGPGGEEAARRGRLVFLPALPFGAWPRVEPDIVNVHLRAYYGALPGEGDNPDAVPFESPVPVHLPVVSPRSHGDRGPLHFRLRVGSVQWDAGEAARGLGLLLDALEWLGAGAKTSVGYGAFRRVDSGVRQEGA